MWRFHSSELSLFSFTRYPVNPHFFRYIIAGPQFNWNASMGCIEHSRSDMPAPAWFGRLKFGVVKVESWESGNECRSVWESNSKGNIFFEMFCIGVFKSFINITKCHRTSDTWCFPSWKKWRKPTNLFVKFWNVNVIKLHNHILLTPVKALVTVTLKFNHEKRFPYSFIKMRFNFGLS